MPLLLPTHVFFLDVGNLERNEDCFSTKMATRRRCVTFVALYSDNCVDTNDFQPLGKSKLAHKVRFSDR